MSKKRDALAHLESRTFYALANSPPKDDVLLLMRQRSLVEFLSPNATKLLLCTMYGML